MWFPRISGELAGFRPKFRPRTHRIEPRTLGTHRAPSAVEDPPDPACRTFRLFQVRPRDPDADPAGQHADPFFTLLLAHDELLERLALAPEELVLDPSVELQEDAFVLPRGSRRRRTPSPARPSRQPAGGVAGDVDSSTGGESATPLRTGRVHRIAAARSWWSASRARTCRNRPRPQTVQPSACLACRRPFTVTSADSTVHIWVTSTAHASCSRHGTPLTTSISAAISRPAWWTTPASDRPVWESARVTWTTSRGTPHMGAPRSTAAEMWEMTVAG